MGGKGRETNFFFFFWGFFVFFVEVSATFLVLCNKPVTTLTTYNGRVILGWGVSTGYKGVVVSVPVHMYIHTHTYIHTWLSLDSTTPDHSLLFKIVSNISTRLIEQWWWGMAPWSPSSRTLPSIKCRLTKVSRNCLYYFSRNCMGQVVSQRKKKIEQGQKIKIIRASITLPTAYSRTFSLPILYAGFSPNLITERRTYVPCTSQLPTWLPCFLSFFFSAIVEIGPQDDTTTPSRDDIPRPLECHAAKARSPFSDACFILHMGKTVRSVNGPRSSRIYQMQSRATPERHSHVKGTRLPPPAPSPLMQGKLDAVSSGISFWDKIGEARQRRPAALVVQTFAGCRCCSSIW